RRIRRLHPHAIRARSPRYPVRIHSGLAADTARDDRGWTRLLALFRAAAPEKPGHGEPQRPRSGGGAEDRSSILFRRRRYAGHVARAEGGAPPAPRRKLQEIRA